MSDKPEWWVSFLDELPDSETEILVAVPPSLILRAYVVEHNYLLLLGRRPDLSIVCQPLEHDFMHWIYA